MKSRYSGGRYRLLVGSRVVVDVEFGVFVVGPGPGFGRKYWLPSVVAAPATAAAAAYFRKRRLEALIMCTYQKSCRDKGIEPLVRED